MLRKMDTDVHVDEDEPGIGSIVLQKLKKRVFEDRLTKFEGTFLARSKTKKEYYRFMSILIKEAIERYPKSVDIRMINA